MSMTIHLPGSTNLTTALKQETFIREENTHQPSKPIIIKQQQFLGEFSRGQYAFPAPRGTLKKNILYSPSRYGGASWSYAPSRSSIIEEFERVKENFLQLSTGQVYVFHGSALAHVAAELLSTWYYYKKFAASIGKTALLIDGGNIFSPYLMGDYARRLGLSPKAVLANIRVSRAFTCHQLEALVTEKARATTLVYDAYLLIVTDATFLLQDSEVKPKEAHEILDRMASCLKKLSRNLDVMVVVTTSYVPEQSQLDLERHLQNYSDSTFEFRSVKVDAKQTRLDTDVEPLLSRLKSILPS